MANVKVYGAVDREGWADFEKYQGDDHDPRFTREWVEERVSEDDWMHLFHMCCEHGFEYLQGLAEEIWPFYGVKVYAEGRSGGWAVVSGIGDVDEWNAVDLAKWRRFERFAKAEAADIPYQMLQSVYLNEFEAWKEDRLEDEPDHDVPELLAALR
jgi:hypothetical protein